MSEAEYVPPKVWKHEKPSGGQFANINKPTAGAQFEKELPVGKHPLQLYSLGTPNGVTVTTSAELAAVILDEAEVAVVPGEAFGPSGYLRLSYALGDEDLAEGVGRIAALLAEAV